MVYFHAFKQNLPMECIEVVQPTFIIYPNDVMMHIRNVSLYISKDSPNILIQTITFFIVATLFFSIFS